MMIAMVSIDGEAKICRRRAQAEAPEKAVHHTE